MQYPQPNERIGTREKLAIDCRDVAARVKGVSVLNPICEHYPGDEAIIVVVSGVDLAAETYVAPRLVITVANLVHASECISLHF